jgi:hypothetical protein
MTKITLATLKSFVRKSDQLYVEPISTFDGMIDGIRYETDRKLIPIDKDKAIGIEGVWLVGSSRDRLSHVENDKYVGIKISNCCGQTVLWKLK